MALSLLKLIIFDNSAAFIVIDNHRLNFVINFQVKKINVKSDQRTKQCTQCDDVS